MIKTPLSTRLLYYLELICMVPILPYLVIKGKKLINSIPKLKPWSEFQAHNPVATNANILIIGESTVAGVGASSEDNTMFGNIRIMFPSIYNLYNIGKVGLKAAYLTKFKQKNQSKLPQKFNKTILLIGANDSFAFTDPKVFLSEINTFLSGLDTDEIYACTIPPVHQFPAIPKLMRHFLRFQRYLLIRQLKLLESHHPNLHIVNFSFESHPDFFAKDGIHPSDLAYRMMTKAIWTKIKSVGEKGDQS
ncbi:SGNH/GDSL hydrolase family protein [Belliella kenyensis]|uniref:SGNH/GDSL hydrolase family protein n=1 Tax=Belliella kenyensis TaxID=1472724 RepID=A0ABV8ENU9_9BACT|nr:SGNH/GDSL hydrolase family protein [Belliella kenyensis]MCH7400569.1 SGNH/GDSL hydrolase family protein [Belliella kenyensis]MDN3602144.1 SGNH/GDSL hydrolase family protein [Belliella kenyensis]